MNYLIRASVVALALIVFSAVPGVAQTPELRAGVSVQMPVTSNAVAVTDADRPGSLIVAVSRNGAAYLEITPVDPASLEQKLKSALAGREKKTVYLKGDARTPFAGVARIMEAAARAGADPTVLLTEQRDPSDAGKRPLPPKGLAVQYGGAAAGSGPRPAPRLIRIEAGNSGQGALALKIDNEQTSLPSVPAAIAQRLRNDRASGIAIEADGSLPFGEVVRVVDACSSSGVKISVAESIR